MGKLENICRLCLNFVSDGEFKAIEETIKEVLDVLVLKLSVEENIQSVICNGCSAKLFTAYKFKVMCLQTEDSIVPYVNSEREVPIDIRKIGLKGESEELLRTILEDRTICRLCMRNVSCKFTSIKDVEMAPIYKYLPEVNFNYTKEPVVCSYCLDSLYIHSSFLENCSDLQDKPKVSPIYVKLEEIDIKLENNKDSKATVYSKDKPYDNETTDEDPSNADSLNSKPDANELPNDPRDKNIPIYKCNTCGYQSIRKSTLLRHQLVHKGPSEVQVYECVNCDYSTKLKYNLLRHQVKHKSTTRAQTYRCGKCSYKTKEKSDVLRHRLSHKGFPQERMFECDECDFKAKHKGNFLRHQIKHKDITEVPAYSCEVCGFKTKYKDNLTSHQLRHKDLSEGPLFACDKCEYRTNVRSDITKHRHTHVKLYKCKSCGFETKHKCNLERHELKHKDVSEVRMYRCDVCDYETKLKGNLTTHQLRHKDLSEVKLYRCSSCDYVAKRKFSLTNHLLKHKRTSEVVHL